ncbi:DUF883 domain-containing protein [Legionella sp.]|uniref:DUF883 domain-containing protein n=1 Tax=Legionella sp. TaxID=459 RepID=UPI003CA8AAD9
MDKWNIKEEGKNTLDNTKEKVSNLYQNVKDQVESTTGQIKETASDFYEESKEKINILEASMEIYTDRLLIKVKKYPLTSLLIAGGIGFVLSKIISK